MSGSILLGEVAAHLATLEIACNRCPGQGKAASIAWKQSTGMVQQRRDWPPEAEALGVIKALENGPLLTEQTDNR